jgi:ABC-2 type transport system permease protein
MFRYLNYLTMMFAMTFGSQAQYRADFVIRIVRAGFEVLLAIIAVNAFYANLPTIAGFSKYEALTIFALFYSIGSLVMMIFGQGIDNLYQDIVSGQFDRYLTMPIDSQIAAGTRFIFITNAFRLTFDFGLLFYAVSKLSISLPWHQWILFVVSGLSGTVIYYCLMFTSSILAFWTFTGEVPFLMHTMIAVARYPVGFFPKNLQMVFYFIPLAFIAYIPASVLLQRNQTLPLLSPLVAVVSLWLVRQIWKAGLKSYSSASS